MPPEFASAIHKWGRRSEPDDLPEWMDEPSSYEDWRSCVRDLEQVSKLTFGYRPIFQFLDALLAKHPSTTKLRILDVGFGGGDTLHRILHWSKAKRLTVELTGIDLNPFAAQAAKERYGHEPVEWLTGNAFTFTSEVDVVLSSLLTHHMTTSMVISFLRWMEHNARLGWFVNDLERSAQSARLFTTLARVMRWHRFVQHDGPVSFARAFVPAEWQVMLIQSGLSLASVDIARSFPSRLCVSRFK